MRDKGERAKGGTLGGQKEPENLTIATSRAHNTTHTQAENTNNVGKAAFLVADYFGPGSTGGEEILKHYSQTRPVGTTGGLVACQFIVTWCLCLIFCDFMFQEKIVPMPVFFVFVICF